MAKITIDLPKDLEFMAKMSSLQWSLWAQRVLREKLEEIEEIKKIAAKSQATEKDVEELSDEINEALWKHYSKYAK